MGPLKGYRIIELGTIGPGPMCGMLLAELGADVVRVDRIRDIESALRIDHRFNLLNRSKRSLAIDLKEPLGVGIVLRLLTDADALIEGFRPGVTERLGLGPAVCAERNPRLVYGRMTGWGQSGPLAQDAGHDLNYIALAGALHAIGRRGGPPSPPLNLVGDFGGGALYLALGVVAALLEARTSNQGQVIDAAMIDGVASLMTAAYALHGAGSTELKRGTNILDSGAHFYDVYETADGHFIALAPLEPKFYRRMLSCLGADAGTLPQSYDRKDWPSLSRQIQDIVRLRTREDWCAIFEGADACFAPVLDLEEAPLHPHNRARRVFVERDGVVQPNPAPRFSRTPSEIGGPPALPGQHSREILLDGGFGDEEVEDLIAQGVVMQGEGGS